MSPLIKEIENLEAIKRYHEAEAERISSLCSKLKREMADVSTPALQQGPDNSIVAMAIMKRNVKIFKPASR